VILAIVCLFLLLGFSPAGAQVSPGPLSRPHSKLDGSLQCLKCHGAGSGAANQDCLFCHKGLAWLVQKGRGLHGREAKKRCSQCHPEHAGRDFELIEWEDGAPEKFSHERSGWPLEGTHLTLGCEDCHKPEFRVSPAATLSNRKETSRSWIGLEPDCMSCHEDDHRGALGANCLECHTNRKWRPAADFDHGRTAFPLTGKHVEVGCAKCHLAPGLQLPVNDKGKRVPLYKPLPHQECSTCHEDSHKGRLGPSCSQCHVTEDFRRVAKESFDHDKTPYPLRGRHRSLRCAECHDSRSAWGKRPPFATCNACHEDLHAGQATLAGRKVDCAECHRVEGFRPSTYTASRHQSSRYPLEGRHRSLKCESCHLKKPPGISLAKLGKAGVLLRPSHDACMDCHEDSHGGQLKGRPHQGACESCHQVEGWKPSTFTDTEHARLEFSLQGRHAEVKCSACHGPERRDLPPLPGTKVLGKAMVALRLEDHDCSSCHLDPHEGPEEGCLACHGFASFRPSSVDPVLHREFTFPLEGAHRAVPCVACHEELNLVAARSSMVSARGRTPSLPFTAGHEECVECHSSPHGEQFALRPGGGACEDCHDAESFRPASRFDHTRDSSFPLEGAHAEAPCAGCHASTADGKGGQITIYRPVPGTCQDCHEGK